MKQFSEATRVQMPAMVHLTRIGYTYFGKLSEDKNGTVYDGDTNILLPVFEQQFKKLNPGHEGEWMQVLKDIRKELNDDDLGRGFYNRLKVVSPVKLIDFDNIENNTFHFTAEVSVSAILSCRPFFILIFLRCIKMKHYGFSRKSIWKNLETFP